MINDEPSSIAGQALDQAMRNTLHGLQLSGKASRLRMKLFMLVLYRWNHRRCSMENDAC